jgi:hypothetical protein
LQYKKINSMRKYLILALTFFHLSIMSQGILPGSDKTEVIETIKNLAINNLDLLNLNNFSFGVSVSPSISWLNVTHNDLTTDGATIAGLINLHAFYKISNQLSVASGLQFGIQGGYVYDDASLLDLTTKNNFLQNYLTLEIPLLLKYNTKPEKKQSYYVQGGFVPGFSLSASEFHQKSSWSNSNKALNINDLSEIYLFSYQIGAGIKKEIWKKNAIFAEINYKSSLANMASVNGYELAARYSPFPVPDIYGGSMVFTFGLAF